MMSLSGAKAAYSSAVGFEVLAVLPSERGGGAQRRERLKDISVSLVVFLSLRSRETHTRSTLEDAFSGTGEGTDVARTVML